MTDTNPREAGADALRTGNKGSGTAPRVEVVVNVGRDAILKVVRDRIISDRKRNPR